MKSWQRVFMKIINIFIPDGAHGDRMRGRLYQPFLKKFGSNFKVGTGALIFNPNELQVGDNVYIGVYTYLGQGEITLEDEVLIGNHVSITATNHLHDANSFRFGGFEAKPIRIGKGTWLAAHSVITAGCNIGEGCLVAAGAVVTKDFGDSVVIGGVPASEIKRVFEKESQI
jgi:maltose O-acetyltransferase